MVNHKITFVDAHCDSMLDVLHGRRGLGHKGNEGQADFMRLREGGVKLQFFAVFIEQPYRSSGALLRALQGIDLFLKEVENNSHQVVLIKSKQDLEDLMKDNRLGAILSIEGGEALEGELFTLDIFQRLGVRSLGLTWNDRNNLADGVGAGKRHRGLTGFGKEVIREMNRMGMLVDLAHIAEKGFWEALEISESPVVVTHANCQRLCSHVRNLTDQQLKAIGEKDGCVGITFVPEFIDSANPTIDKLLDHVEHAAAIAGIDHVGFGSDFDGMDKILPELGTALEMPRLVEGLGKRGFSDEEIFKLTGGNWLRVLKHVLPADR